MARSDQRPATEADFDESLALKRQAAAPALTRMPSSQLADLVRDASGGSLPQAAAGPLVEWTARSPYDPVLGQLYGFNLSRWDTPDDIVYMYPVRQSGPGSGEWDGSVAYVDFHAPAAETYVIVAHYAGINSVVRLWGPWGTVERSMPAGLEADAVAATWTGSGTLQFTVSFRGVWLGHLVAVQVFQIS